MQVQTVINLNEVLAITDVTDRTFVTGVSNGHLSDTDQFSTRNQFYGGQLGTRSALRLHRLGLELEGRVAIGSNLQSVGIDGATSDTLVFPYNRTGGVLALITNIGRYHRREFTIMPEVKAHLAYKFSSHLRAFVGYDFLYWNKVVRPGEQIDRVVNPNLIQHVCPICTDVINGPLRPAFAFNHTSFWAQGLNIGIQMRF